jgi:hypothetical protein
MVIRSTFLASEAVRRHSPAGFVLAALLALAGCDSGQASQGNPACQEAAMAILDGARCLMREAGGGAVNLSPGARALDGETCDRRVRQFRQWGLGTYDAEEILRTTLDTYFKKYRQRPFCAELRVQQNFGYSLTR